MDFTEQIERAGKTVEGNKAALVKAVEADDSVGSIASATSSLAAARGHKDGLEYVSLLVKHHSGKGLSGPALSTEVLAGMVDKLCTLETDTYSGRGNDVIRSNHDGWRRAMNDLRFTVAAG